jgi:MMPL family protein
MLREAKVEQTGISAVVQARNATWTQHPGPVSRKLFQEPTFGVKRPLNVAGPASSVLDQHLRCLATGRIDGADVRNVARVLAAIGMFVALVASLTLAPAVLVIGSRFGLLEPKRKTAKRGWRRIGTAIVRWLGRS